MCQPIITKLPHGLFIALEGIDGSGKTTVAHNLAQHFTSMGFSTVLTKEPGGTQLGQHLRTLLHDRNYELDPKAEFLCFAADRAQHITYVIKPALQAGSIVISDRTGDSSLAYQGYGRGIDREYIENINNWATDFTKPDITLYLRIDYQTARTRLRERTKLTSFEQEDVRFFERVIHGFETIFAHRSNVITLDAQESIELVTNKALQRVCDFLKAKADPAEITDHEHNHKHISCCSEK
jgi:dTMP kinase